MKLGYSTWGMPNVPINVIIPHLARLGYDGVELTVIPGWSIEMYSLDQDERRRIRKLVKEYGLELPAVAGHTSLVDPDPATHARNFQRLKDEIDLCVEWALDGEPPCLDTTPGGKPDQWEELKPTLIERTAELVEYAASRGVVVAMEPHFAAAISTPERVSELLAAVPSPYLRVTFDISHFNIQGYSIQESVAALAPVAAFTHVKDEKGQVPDFEFLIPGEGVFDYVTYLKEMQKAGYEGHIAAEISIMVQRRENYDALEAATQTYRVLAKAFDEAGIARRADRRMIKGGAG